MATTIAQPPAAVNAHDRGPEQAPAGIAPQVWAAAVHAEAVRLKSSARNLGRRLDDAQDLVLGGAVSQDAEGMWRVESRTTPGVAWQVSGSCDCPDAERQAREHRLAVGLTKRALKAVHGCPSAPVQTAADGAGWEDAHPLTAPLPGLVVAQACPEAAISLCIKGLIDGHEAQLTVRGQTVEEFRRNLAAVGRLFDEPADGASAPAHRGGAAPTPEAPPTCPTHGPMKPSAKAPGSWYCTKKLYDGSYCQSRHP